MSYSLSSSFAEFLSRMAKASEAEGRLLGKTSVLFGSNLGSANSHDPRNLPILVAGGGYKHGSYVAHDTKINTPLCNLFVSLLNNTGIESEHFGTSTGTLQIWHPSGKVVADESPKHTITNETIFRYENTHRRNCILCFVTVAISLFR